MSTLAFSVIGQPGAQGSKRHVGRGILVESSKKVAPWRQDVAAAASYATSASFWGPIDGPVSVVIDFTFTRPKSHYRTGRNSGLLRDDAPNFVTSRAAGDLDKLLRSTFDALTNAGIWVDDSQVAVVTATKTYGAQAGAYIAISTGEQA